MNAQSRFRRYATLIFSVKGRIGRASFAKASAVVFLAIASVAVAIGTLLVPVRAMEDGLFEIIKLPLSFFLTFAACSMFFGLFAKRLHDLGASALWALVIFIPGMAWILLMLMLLALPGQEHDNRFGTPPMKPRSE
jgi:uncharacterized membrane protein YhaH (DUF805 family)